MTIVKAVPNLNGNMKQMPEEIDITYMVMTFVGITAIIAVVCKIIVSNLQKKLRVFKREAINRRFARWVTDEDGNTKFQWNDFEGEGES